MVLVVAFCNQIFPIGCFSTGHAGRWAARLVWPIRLLLWLTTPITVLIRFFFSVASLAEEPASRGEKSRQCDVEALLEAGEEEGILEENDRDLVRSAVEFGDKLVREVMTPRPRSVCGAGIDHAGAVSAPVARAQLSRACRSMRARIDNITGIAFAHDLLQITDDEAHTRTVASIQRPAAFVPETKRGYELLREMQREKQHMRIVIDEYGGVAGLVTIEDLLEQIVGDIRDEHEEDAPGRRSAARTRRRLGGAGRLSRGSACRSFRRSRSTWARDMKPPPSAAW